MNSMPLISRSAFRRIFRTFSVWCMALAALTACAKNNGGPSGPFILHLSPSGNDLNTGRTADRPLATLERAHAILEEARPSGDVKILFAPGTYRGLRVNWSYSRPDRRIVFRPADPTAGPVTFNGCPQGMDEGCPGGTWLTLSHARGEWSNLTFEHLRFENYQTVMSFNGNRLRPDTGYNGGNVIRHCTFLRIGNVFNPEARHSTAVVRLVNSRENIIEDNHFEDIINVQRGGLIHALYLAHHADRNEVHRNVFINHSGDPVRVRDFSNGNVITQNTFIRAGTTGGYSEWYCDQSTRDDCTKTTPECPSWNNVFRDNRLGTDFEGNPLQEKFFAQGDSTPGCGPLTPDARRLIASGNVRID